MNKKDIDSNLLKEKIQWGALFRVGTGVTIAAAKYAAMGGLASSYFSDRNKGAIIIGSVTSSVLAMCCNFSENLVNTDNKQRNRDYKHVQQVVGNKVKRILNKDDNKNTEHSR